MASIARPAALRQSCALLTLNTRATTSRSPITAFASLNAAQLKNKQVSSRIAAFHASSRKDILPPLPQTVIGTMNDAAPVPPTSPSHGSYHWTFERLIAASLIPLTIAPFAAGSLNPVMDAVLCGTIVIHSHMGFQAAITDYFPTYRVPKTNKFLGWVLRGATLTVAVGLYEFETNDIGITAAIKRVWKA
ncbi:membrane anchor subunit of succinate dehydrogenase, Sdh4 [Myotisia sp. PD_48]|nr:membrane anchor subunit of succinate dehydrogenase, Sdh4 [Myotisia sp. PD_48]